MAWWPYERVEGRPDLEKNMKAKLPILSDHIITVITRNPFVITYCGSQVQQLAV
jgi:hypothetical protein